MGIKGGPFQRDVSKALQAVSRILRPKPTPIRPFGLGCLPGGSLLREVSLGGSIWINARAVASMFHDGRHNGVFLVPSNSNVLGCFHLPIQSALPYTVTRTLRRCPAVRCSHKYIPCHVPSSKPRCPTGIVNSGLVNTVRTCAGMSSGPSF